jgi:PAS domain S-box-containing protein
MTTQAVGSTGRRLASTHSRRPGSLLADLKLLASIVESADDAIISKTLDGVIMTWNKAAERIYGYPADEAIGQPISLIIPPDHPGEMTKILDQIGSGERVDHFETTRLRKDGAIITVSVTVSALHDATGRVVGVSSIARDITERERVQNQALFASRYARSLIEASRDPLVTISAEGKITDVNEATIRVTGVGRDQLVGTDFSDYFTEPDQARAVYRQVFAQGFVTDYPLTIRHTGGELTDVLYNVSVYKDGSGSVLGVVAAARDVTAQKRAENELAKQRILDLERLADLERFQKLTVGRELRMIELKKEIEALRTAAKGT